MLAEFGHGVSRSTLKRLYATFGGMCAIADCPYPNRLSDGTPNLEVAHIESPVPGGVRFNPSMTMGEVNNYENLLLLCPSHHREIDTSIEYRSAETLRRIRDKHIDRIASLLESATHPNRPTATNRLQEALQIWQDERYNDSEEYWHRLFVSRPELLAPVVHRRAFALNSKCYVGGKAVDNSGGNILDFLLQHDGDVVLVEIKTPTSDLLAGEYRTNVYPPSRELAGAVSQVLTYRLSLLNELHSLQAQTPGLMVHNPSMFVVIGDIEREGLSHVQRRSFELFRGALKDVTVLTYDELFKSIANLTVWMEPPSE